jgi:CheY-like chemotaxis protein
MLTEAESHAKPILRDKAQGEEKMENRAVAHALQVASANLEAGRLDEAERICSDLLKTNATNPWALGMLACVANKRKQHKRALELIQRAFNGGSDMPVLYFEKAQAHAALGDRSAGLQAIRRAVKSAPDLPGAYLLLSKLMYPGMDYYEVLALVHEHLRPRSYVEIGVATGSSLVLCKGATIAVGIDPEPRLMGSPKAVTKIIPFTSDAYFEKRDLRSDMECECVDFAFIDGLHVFEQTLRDFINVERFAGPRTVVAIHDVLPIDALTAERERKTSYWTGDIWRVPLCLRESRPELEIFIIPTPPSGLCLVRGLDPTSRVLSDDFDRVVGEYRRLELSAAEDRRSGLETIENSRDTIRSRLGQRPSIGD